MSFPALVDEHFAFLVNKYGFVRLSPPECQAGEMVTFRKEPVSILIGWYKGEIDIDFCVDLDFAAHHPIFRPYVSRTFRLEELALKQDADAYAAWAARSHQGNYITTLEEAGDFLHYSAAVMKRSVKPVLQGDMTMLEEVTKQRRRMI